jgi:hypothetical protein
MYLSLFIFDKSPYNVYKGQIFEKVVIRINMTKFIFSECLKCYTESSQLKPDMLALMQAYLLWIEFLLKGKICLERYKVFFFYRD